MTDRENHRRAVCFERPEWIPITMDINASCFHHYDSEALKKLMCSHKRLFPDVDENWSPPERSGLPGWRRAGERYTDPWGCVWETTDDGITGAVIQHPLEDWKELENYTPPDPEEAHGKGIINWDEVAERVQKAHKEGRWVRGGLDHGHTFLRLCDLRGYQNLIYDMVDGSPELRQLIEMVETFNRRIVEKHIELGVDEIGYPEDLGMQKGPMLSPAHFREYIKPSYERLVAPAKEAGRCIHMHSDGDIRELADDLIDVGIESLNLQDLVNGIDWIKDNIKGRACIDLDIDRQKVTRFGSPGDVEDLIHEEVEKLGSPEGGLTMIAGIYPGIPLENIRALMDAMEKYSTYYK
jgi:uroporphyrinogen decarboxylase